MDAIVPPAPEPHRLHVAIVRGSDVDELELDIHDTLTVGTSPAAGLTLPELPWRDYPLLQVVPEGIELLPDPAMYAKVDGEPVDEPTIVEPLSGAEVHLGGLTIHFRVDATLAVPEPDETAPEPMLVLEEPDEQDAPIVTRPPRGKALLGAAAATLGGLALAAGAVFAVQWFDTPDTTAAIATFDGGATVTPTRTEHTRTRRARAHRPAPAAAPAPAEAAPPQQVASLDVQPEAVPTDAQATDRPRGFQFRRPEAAPDPFAAPAEDDFAPEPYPTRADTDFEPEPYPTKADSFEPEPYPTKADHTPAPTDDRALRSAFTENLPDLEFCVADARERDPAIAGQIRLQWVVADGRALDASVVEDTTGDAALSSCVARRAAHWTFPAGTHGTVGPFAVDLS